MLTPDARWKLMHGSRVKVSPHQIGAGHHSFAMSRRKAASVMKSRSMGKGRLISLSAAEIRQSAIHGSGFLDFLKKAGSFLAPVARGALSIAKPFLGAVASSALNKLAGKAGPLGDIVQGLGQIGLQKLGIAPEPTYDQPAGPDLPPGYSIGPDGGVIPAAPPVGAGLHLGRRRPSIHPGVGHRRVAHHGAGMRVHRAHGARISQLVQHRGGSFML